VYIGVFRTEVAQDSKNKKKRKGMFLREFRSEPESEPKCDLASKKSK
jgi:hypothetical protein